jgi:hypothetical protein
MELGPLSVLPGLFCNGRIPHTAKGWGFEGVVVT